MENPNLESLRDEIDRIDEQVVRLLNDRVQAAVEIGRIKDKLGVDPYDPAREEQVFDKIRAINEGPMQGDSLRAIYREVISASIALEKELVIGYLGPEATYTHQAAVKNFGTALAYRSLPDIPDVFQAVEQGSAITGLSRSKIRPKARLTALSTCWLKPSCELSPKFSLRWNIVFSASLQ